MDAARELGRECAERGTTIVYGAGKVGLMGALAEECLKGGGRIVGVIPRFMVERGWCHEGLTELVVTETMGERKQVMRDRSDALIALPGGCGTLEELLEAITQRQMTLYNHPIVIVNIGGYFDALLRLLERAEREGFMREQPTVRKADSLWLVAGSVEEALEYAGA